MTPLVSDLVLTYVVALAAVLALAPLRIPSVVALMVAGGLAGPSGFALVRNEQSVEVLANIGVDLLLFTVGLDFSLRELQRMWRQLVVGGFLQMAGTTAAVALVLVAIAGRPASFAIFIGIFVAMTSTALLLRGLADRDELDAPHGRLAVAVSLFQDLAFVVLLMLLPVFAGHAQPAETPALLARALGAIVMVGVLGRSVLPRLLRAVVRAKRREAFPLALLVASAGTAWLCAALGLSTSLGAFLGGLVLAESEFSHQAQAEIRPLRDILSSLFFVSLGMLVNLPELAMRLPLVLALAAAILVGKIVVGAAALRGAGSATRVAVSAAVALAPVGEFSFIFGRAGFEAGVLPPGTWQLLLLASVVTLVVGPFLIGGAPALGRLVGGRPTRRARGREAAAVGHVLVLGFGLGGRLIAAALRVANLPYLVLELNGTTVQRERARGEPIVYGDATHPQALQAAGVDRARAVVMVLSDPEATRRAVRAVRQLAPRVPIVVRTRYRTEADEMLALGATVVAVEEIETSLEVLAQLLVRLGLAASRVEAILETLRHESIVRSLRGPADATLVLPDVLREAEVSAYEVGPGDWAADRTIAQTALRSATGASVVALGRGEVYMTSPDPSEPLRVGDILYLVGPAASIEGARRLLRDGPGESGPRPGV
jgi:CPA2 family monovalent cation:H+ antiporter-2